MPPRRSLSPHWSRYEPVVPTVFDEPPPPEPEFFLNDDDYIDTSSDEDDHLSYLAEVETTMNALYITAPPGQPEYSAYDQNDPDTWTHEQHLDFVRSVRALNAARLQENPEAALFSIYPGPSGELMFQSQVHLVPGTQADLPEFFRDHN